MKHLFLLVAALFMFNGSIWACPNLSGEYEFNHNGDKLAVKQRGCESIEVHIVWNNYIASFITDGKPYERSYDSNHNSNSNIPATKNSWSFDKASYTGEKFVWQEFSGDPSKCVGKYSFADFDCKVFEHSFSYNSELKAYIWTQVGFWRSYDGAYGNDELLLKKVH